MKLSGPGSNPRAGLPAAGEISASPGQHILSRPSVASVNVHAKRVHARAHTHTQLRKDLYAIVFLGALWPPVVFRNLIFMNQVTKPTSNQAGERKQMLFQPGGVELSSLSLWLNPACIRTQHLVKIITVFSLWLRGLL